MSKTKIFILFSLHSLQYCLSLCFFSILFNLQFKVSFILFLQNCRTSVDHCCVPPWSVTSKVCPPPTSKSSRSTTCRPFVMSQREFDTSTGSMTGTPARWMAPSQAACLVDCWSSKDASLRSKAGPRILVGCSWWSYHCASKWLITGLRVWGWK